MTCCGWGSTSLGSFDSRLVTTRWACLKVKTLEGRAEKKAISSLVTHWLSGSKHSLSLDFPITWVNKILLIIQANLSWVSHYLQHKDFWNTCIIFSQKLTIESIFKNTTPSTGPRSSPSSSKSGHKLHQTRLAFLLVHGSSPHCLDLHLTLNELMPSVAFCPRCMYFVFLVSQKMALESRGHVLSFFHKSYTAILEIPQSHFS